ncbi:MAG TPA: hypothetical protein VEP46_18450 [Vicinamibacterales bacterium]|nr:hypothetical protein [Vicinamibacterales bacterium]
MLLAIVFAAVLAASQAAPQDVPVLKANLGDCSADFTVRGADGQPVYNATIHVRVRYGFMSVKRSDLEIGTNGDGKARIEGLPSKAKPLVWDVRKGDLKAAVTQDVADMCRATFDAALK